MKLWTEKTIKNAIDAFSSSSSYEDALRKLSEKIGRKVTKDSVVYAFKANGFSPPSEHLIKKGPSKTKSRVKSVHTTVQSISTKKAVGEEVLHTSEGLEPILFIPDCHVPFHDQRAFSLVVKVARALNPKKLVVLGDFADFYCVSSHDKDPARRLLLREEVASANAVLDVLDELAPEKYFVEGNHEYRLHRYLMTKSPELFGLVSAKELFKLEDRGWSYTPYMKHLKIGKLHVTHETGNAGPQANAKARATFEGNVVIGHTHRAGVQYQGNAKGATHVGAMFGWLGDADAIDYMHKVKTLEWQLGFGVGSLEKSTGNVFLQVIPIVDYKCVVNGKLFVG